MTINFKKGNMKEERKAKYVTPQIEIIEMESEGVMALSNMPGGNPGMPGSHGFPADNRSCLLHDYYRYGHLPRFFLMWTALLL